MIYPIWDLHILSIMVGNSYLFFLSRLYRSVIVCLHDFLYSLPQKVNGSESRLRPYSKKCMECGIIDFVFVVKQLMTFAHLVAIHDVVVTSFRYHAYIKASPNDVITK